MCIMSEGAAARLFFIDQLHYYKPYITTNNIYIHHHHRGGGGGGGRGGGGCALWVEEQQQDSSLLIRFTTISHISPPTNIYIHHHHRGGGGGGGRGGGGRGGGCALWVKEQQQDSSLLIRFTTISHISPPTNIYVHQHHKWGRGKGGEAEEVGGEIRKREEGKEKGVAEMGGWGGGGGGRREEKNVDEGEEGVRMSWWWSREDISEREIKGEEEA